MKKIIYFLFAVFFVVWFGGSIIRNVMIFDIFVPAAALEFKPEYSDELINYNIKLFSATSVYTNASYSAAFLLLIAITIISSKQLKKEGWLFMSIALFFLSSPVILYNIYLDFSLSYALHFNDFSYLKNLSVQDAIFLRYSNSLNTVLSGIAYLANANIILYLVYKPLSLKDFNEINEKS